MVVVQTILTICAVIIAIPLIVLFVECVAALFGKKAQISAESPPRTTILMPAHNEETVIGHTLQALQPHLNEHIKAIVIADNCSDDTADIVRQYDVQLLERSHATDRGKGFALDFGLQHLETDPPEVVVMLDADSTVEDNGIAHIASMAKRHNRPIQAIYLMKSPPDPSTKDLISAFAFCVKNLVRPKGLHTLGQPCLLTGTGMAVPWEIIQNAPLASGNIVEDMQLGYDLAIESHSPLLAPDVLVLSALPQQTSAATTQRTRWEHGHMQTLLTQCPRLLKGALTQRRLDLLVLALDLFIPPLALLVFIWLISSVIFVAFGLMSGLWLPATVSAFAGLLLLLAIGLAWVGFGRNDLPFTKLLSVPLYILWKIPLYLKFIVQRQTAWVRTERDSVG